MKDLQLPTEEFSLLLSVILPFTFACRASRTLLSMAFWASDSPDSLTVSRTFEPSVDFRLSYYESSVIVAAEDLVSPSRPYFDERLQQR